jgi:hypothetical protein
MSPITITRIWITGTHSIARELERAVVGLLTGILGARIGPMPGWLTCPGRID